MVVHFVCIMKLWGLRISLFAFGILLLSCQKEKDLVWDKSLLWIQDDHGCKAIRIGLKEDLEKVRLQLIGLSEKKLTQVLGKPEATDIRGRSQRFHFYYLNGSPTCEKASEGKVLILAIRLNATNIVSEAYFTNSIK